MQIARKLVGTKEELIEFLTDYRAERSIALANSATLVRDKHRIEGELREFALAQVDGYRPAPARVVRGQGMVYFGQDAAHKQISEREWA